MSIEYDFTCDLLRLFLRSNEHGSFNGFVGVAKGSFFEGERFDEEVLCEDINLNVRMYLKGKVAVPAKTSIGEQAPTTLKDLYHQRVRWFSGGVEVLKYLIPMFKAPIPFSRKISWLFTATSQYYWFLTTPIAVIYLGKIKKLSDGPPELVKIFVGYLGYAWLMTICGIVAIIKHLISSNHEWKPTIRSDV